MSFSRFTGEAFGFYASYDDKIEDAPTGDMTVEGRNIVQSANLNTVTLVGAEAGGRWQWREWGTVFGNFTFTWGEEKFRDGQKPRRTAFRLQPVVWEHLPSSIHVSGSSRIWSTPFLNGA